jgi:hypothetical protein
MPQHIDTTRELNAAHDAYHALDPDTADDTTAAKVIADWLLSLHAPPYRLGIDHDSRKRKPRHLHFASGPLRAEMLFKSGPCLLAYEWHYKNRVGIKTDDRDHARAWIVDGLYFGYTVTRVSGPGPINGTCGSIAGWRYHAKQRKQHRSKSHA